MKKLLLTVCTAAAFSLAAMGQEEQDTTQRQSDQYRPIPQQEDQDTTEYQDTVDMEEGVQYRENLEQTEQNLDSTFNELNEELEEGEENLREEEEQVEEDVEQEVDETRQDIEEAGEDIEQGAEEMRDTLEQESDNNNIPADAYREDVKVIDAKEGPNHEVVYEYKGEMFYVDREKKEIVKVKRSDLRDSRHDVQIKGGTASGDDSKMKDKRSKG